MTFGTRGFAAAVIAALLALPSLAAGQSYPPPGSGRRPPPPPRSPFQQPDLFAPRGGLYGGLGLGFGQIRYDCDICREEAYGGVAFQANLGVRFTPRLGVFGDVSSVAAPGFEIVTVDRFVEDAALWNTLVVAGVQGWLLPALWLKGGIGFAQEIVRSEFTEVDGSEGTALLVAAGYELLHSPTLSIDLELRVGTALYDQDVSGTATNGSLALSINFHQVYFGGYPGP